MPITIGLGLSAATAIYGGIKSAQANKLAKNNLANRPKYEPLPEDDSQLNLAESQANQGMGAGARQALLNNSQNNTAVATNAVLMGGGDANTIGNIVDKSQQGLNNLGIYDDQARQAHIGTLLATYGQYANQRQANADKKFQINSYAPWADKQQLYSKQQEAGQQLMSQGISSLGKGLMSMNWGGDNSPDITKSTPTGSNMQAGWNGQGASWMPGYGPNSGQGYPAGAGYGMDDPQTPGIMPYFGSGNQYA